MQVDIKTSNLVTSISRPRSNTSSRQPQLSRWHAVVVLRSLHSWRYSLMPPRSRTSCRLAHLDLECGLLEPAAKRPRVSPDVHDESVHVLAEDSDISRRVSKPFPNTHARVALLENHPKSLPLEIKAMTLRDVGLSPIHRGLDVTMQT